MGQLSFALLIATSLALTTYFGVVAWHTSDDSIPSQVHALR
jgi:hypothetical protein